MFYKKFKEKLTPEELRIIGTEIPRSTTIRAAAKWEKAHGTPAHPGYRSLRIHDLKHTLGRRLRVAGVTEEDRQALLGHKNGSITSHYSAAELEQLIDAANKVVSNRQSRPGADDSEKEANLGQSLGKSLTLEITKPPEGG